MHNINKFETQIDNSGRIKIPEEILSELHLRPGTTLLILEQNGKISLEPVMEEPELIDINGLLIVRPKITGDIRNIVDQNREERISE